MQRPMTSSRSGISEAKSFKSLAVGERFKIHSSNPAVILAAYPNSTNIYTKTSEITFASPVKELMLGDPTLLVRRVPNKNKGKNEVVVEDPPSGMSPSLGKEALNFPFGLAYGVPESCPVCHDAGFRSIGERFLKCSACDNGGILAVEETAGLVQSFADKSGKSVEEVERLWNRAKGIARKEYGIDSGNRFYATVVGILKRMLGISEGASKVSYPRILGVISEVHGAESKAVPFDTLEAGDRFRFTGRQANFHNKPSYTKTGADTASVTDGRAMNQQIDPKTLVVLLAWSKDRKNRNISQIRKELGIKEGKGPLRAYASYAPIFNAQEQEQPLRRALHSLLTGVKARFSDQFSVWGYQIYETSETRSPQILVVELTFKQKDPNEVPYHTRSLDALLQRVTMDDKRMTFSDSPYNSKYNRLIVIGHADTVMNNYVRSRMACTPSEIGDIRRREKIMQKRHINRRNDNAAAITRVRIKAKGDNMQRVGRKW